MYHRILVPIDGSPTSDRGVDEATRLALVTGGRIKLMHVLDEITMTAELAAYAGNMGDWMEELRQDARKLVDRSAASVRGRGVDVTTFVQDSFAGPLHEPVTAEALAWKADLIVLGTHGRRGLMRLYLGSGAESILRFSPVPVLLVRHAETAAVHAAVQPPRSAAVPA